MLKALRYLADSGLIALVIVLFLTLIIDWPWVQRRRVRRRPSCVVNLHRISVAVHNFASTNEERLPPLSHGPQELSWRVALLPLLDQAAMYRAYHRDKPWNDPANREFAETKIPEFHCPDNPTPRDALGRYYTAYAFLTGPGTAYDQPEPRTLEDLRNGLSQTLLAVEACGANIVWNEPRDLDVVREGIVPDPKRDSIATAGGWVSPHHPDYVNVVYADGSTRTLSLKIDPEVRKALSKPSNEPAR